MTREDIISPWKAQLLIEPEHRPCQKWKKFVWSISKCEDLEWGVSSRNLKWAKQHRTSLAEVEKAKDFKDYGKTTSERMTARTRVKDLTWSETVVSMRTITRTLHKSSTETPLLWKTDRRMLRTTWRKIMDTGALVETWACAPQRCCLHMEKKEGVYNPKNTVCGSIMHGGCFSASRAGNLIKVEERRICKILKENLKEEWVVIWKSMKILQ